MADDKTAAEPKPWRCKTCGSTRPVAARAGREMDGFPLMAQCVEHGHWNKPPKEWGDAPSLESPLAADVANGAMMLDDIVSRSTEEGNRG